MDKITTEEVMDTLDMFQYRSGKIENNWLLGFRNNFSRCRHAIYLHGVQGRMKNLWCEFEVSSSGTPVDKQIGQSYMENVMYNCTLYYGTCESLGIIYSF